MLCLMVLRLNVLGTSGNKGKLMAKMSSNKYIKSLTGTIINNTVVGSDLASTPNSTSLDEKSYNLRRVDGDICFMENQFRKMIYLNGGGNRIKVLSLKM